MKLQKGRYYYVTYTDHTKKPRVTHVMYFLGMGSIKGHPVLRFQKDNQINIIDKEAILSVREAKPDKTRGGWRKGRELRLEASYKGNMGVMEVFQFYKLASKQEKAMFDRLVNKNKHKEAWRLVQKVTGTKLQGAQFESMELVRWVMEESD